MLPEDQVVRYAQSNGRDIAWSSVGAGPPLILGGWWSSHLILDWASEEFRTFIAAFAEHFTVIRYDPPGMGASRSPQTVPHDIRTQCDALLAVLDAAGVTSASLVAGSSGCPVAVAFAATYPDRVRQLVLYGGYLRGTDISSPTDRLAMLELMRTHWGLTSRVLTDIFIPDATSAQREAFARTQRRTASPDEAASALSAVYDMDASEWADQVRSPALVLHRRFDRAIPFALGKQLADAIPRSTFLPLEGLSHYPWYGDSGSILTAVEDFLGVATAPRVNPQSPPVEITPREHEIMTLVARGLTDAQIAAALYLSVHTVHRHVANVRTKLGVPSRSAAAALIAAQPSPAGATDHGSV